MEAVETPRSGLNPSSTLASSPHLREAQGPGLQAQDRMASMSWSWDTYLRLVIHEPNTSQVLGECWNRNERGRPAC